MFQKSDTAAMRTELAQWRALLDVDAAPNAARLLTILSLREMLHARSGEPAGLRAVLRESAAFAPLRDAVAPDKLTSNVAALRMLARTFEGTDETMYALIHVGAVQWSDSAHAYKLVTRRAA